MTMTIEQEIGAKAAELGFVACGFARADAAAHAGAELMDWLGEGRHGEMGWMVENPLAAAAGIGWQGKHTNLLSREHGNWLFLGIIYTSLELQPDHAAAAGMHCGSCSACITACPTGAITGPHRIDARRCISYL